MNAKAPRWSARGTLLVLPLLFALTALGLARQRGPLWLGQNSDPSYQYLFNSLLILNGQPPCHIDHPGTTVQTLGAVVLSATTPGRDRDEKTSAVLADPERALFRLHAFFLLLTALALVVAGLLVLERTGSAALAWALQLTPLLQPGTYRATLFVAPEALLVPLTILFIAFLIIRESALESPATVRQETAINILLGLLAAAGLVTKITFAPLCLLPLLVQRSWRGVAWTGSAMLAGTALYLAPIYSQLPRMFHWFTQLATHQGIYGSGAPGLVDTAAFPGNVLTLAISDRVLAVAILAGWVAAGVALAGRAGGERSRRLVRLVLLVTTVQVLGVLLVAKHPSPHYLLPVALLSALDFVLLIQLLRESPPPPRRRALLAGAGVVLAAATALVARDVVRLGQELHTAREVQLQQTRRADELSADGIRVDYYRSSSLPFALCFGNSFAWRLYGGPLERLHPRRVFFNLSTGWFESFAGRLPPTEVFGGKKLYLVDNSPIERLPPGWRMTLVERDGDTTIHLLQKTD